MTFSGPVINQSACGIYLSHIIMFHIVDSSKQCGQQNIVQSCYTAGSEFLAVHEIVRSILSLPTHVKKVGQRSTESRGFSPNALVSSHREC